MSVCVLPFSADVGLFLAVEEELGPGCCSELTQDLFRPLLESTLAGLCTYSWASSLIRQDMGLNGYHGPVMANTGVDVHLSL